MRGEKELDEIDYEEDEREVDNNETVEGRRKGMKRGGGTET